MLISIVEYVEKNIINISKKPREHRKSICQLSLIRWISQRRDFQDFMTSERYAWWFEILVINFHTLFSRTFKKSGCIALCWIEYDVDLETLQLN